jgi:hypothetical protein
MFPEAVRGTVPWHRRVIPPAESVFHGGQFLVADRAVPEGAVTVLLCRRCGARREYLIDLNDLLGRCKARPGKEESNDAKRLAYLARVSLMSQLDTTLDQWEHGHAHCRAGDVLDGCHPQVRDQALLVAEGWSAELRRSVQPAPFIAPIEPQAVGGCYTLPMPNDDDMPPGLSPSDRAFLVPVFAIGSIAGLRARYRRRAESLLGAVSCLVEWADRGRDNSVPPAGELVTQVVDEHVGYEGRAPISVSGSGRDAAVDVGQTVWRPLTCPSVWIDGILAGRRRVRLP